MDKILGPIPDLLGKYLYFIYNTVAFENYGLAIIIFTVTIKLLLLPLTFKQLKSTARMQEVQPQLKELQERYKGDKEKYSQEMMKFYQENKINPAAGCLPLLVQMPILFSLYWAVVQPMQRMLGKSKGDIAELVSKTATFVKDVPSFEFKKGFYEQIQALNFYSEYPQYLDKVSKYLTKDELLNMHFPSDFFGINLGLVPSFLPKDGVAITTYISLLIIPIMAVAATYFSTKMSMPKANKNNPNSQMMGMMLYFAPGMTALFAFQFPVGMALYWTTSSLFQLCQQIFINKRKKQMGEVGKK